jgi:hypothetical protein
MLFTKTQILKYYSGKNKNVYLYITINKNENKKDVNSENLQTV